MPHFPDTAAVATLLARAREALHLTQNELAELLGVARRTVNRWEGRESTPSVAQLRQLASAVYPRDASLASEIAAEGDATLEGLGLSDPMRKAAPGHDVSSRRFPPVDLVIDSIVHVAAQALMAEGPGEDPVVVVRAVLREAFARARGLGLTLEEVDGVLSAPTEGVAPSERSVKRDPSSPRNRGSSPERRP